MLSEAKQRALELRLRGGSAGVSWTQDGAPPTITALDWDRPAPLSFAQQRLWFLHQLEEDSTAYNAPLALRLRGRLDEGALRAAAEAVVARHEILRTRLVALEGVPQQVVDPPGEFLLEVVDIGHSNDPARAADALVAQDEMVRFDLATGPLFRGRLIRIATDDHVLSLVMHHLVTDEWSEGILRRELAALYAACAAGDPSPLPPLPVQYRDFARWQRDWLQGEVLEDQLGYWRERLAGAALLDLPTDRPRPPIRSSAGAVVDFEIPAEAVAGLRAVARDAGATTFMSALAAFSVVLGRHAGLDDVVVGTPVANRGRPEIEGLIGPVLNTLVLRTDLAGDPTFGELVSRVRQHALEAYARQDLPFEQLVEAIQPERDRSRTPLFQVLFNYEQADDDEPGLGGLEISEYADRRSTARFDLSLFLVESGGRMGGTLEYSTELFDRSTIERLARHLVALADAVARQPRRRLSELSLLGDAERRQVVDDWNRTRAPEPEETIHQQVARRAAQHPEATAVVYAGQAVSYSRLDQQANRLARHLQAKGVGPETVVGVCLDRGPELVVALLAVLKAGGTYLPLDPEHPPERLAFMLADSGATLVVGTRGGPQVPTELVALDDPDTAAAVAAAPADAPDGAIAGPDQLAYVMYTSGSTGRPKAVMVPHRGLANRVAWMQDAYDLTVDDRVLHKTPSTFDVSLWELLWPLTVGATMVVAEPGQHRDVERLAALIAAERVTVAHFVPSLFHEFVTRVSVAELSDVRLVVCSGEALAGEDVARFYAERGTAVVENLYGPTEASIDVSSWRCQIDEPPPPIGRPIANTQLYVLDPFLAPTPVGVPGELHIGGIGLARGYGARPDLTAERFVADPFGAPGTRLYRTGDRARWRTDGRQAAGHLEFLGRIDEQVQVRGHRIEPGEIEAALLGHPAVDSVAVVARGEGAERRLVAYVVPDQAGGKAPSTGELRAFLGGRLPGYMVPSVFVPLEELPLGPNGKLDRASLPAPDGARPRLSAAFTAPRTPTEQLVAALWAGVLGVDRVGVDDNFFDLGGHSLLATQVMSRLRTAFGVDLALAQLFDYPTVAQMAPLIDAAARAVPAPPISPVDRSRPLPVSYAQQRLWFVEQLEPGSVEYNVPFAVRLAGPLDTAALQKALDTIVERHEALRTRLVSLDGVAHQMIDPPARFPLELVDLGNQPDAVERTEQLVAQDAVTPLDLAVGPLCRGRLIRLGAEEHVLSLVVHHVACDEWSLGVLRWELSVLYAAFRDGQPSPLAPLAVQYGDFAVWQRAWLQGDNLDIQLGYWRERLAGVPALELPTDRPRPAVRTAVGQSIGFEVPAEVVAALRALSRSAGGTMFMTLLGAYSVMLGRHAAQTDVAVGTPLANRNRAEIEDVIGLFVNTLVVRTDLSGDPSFAEVLARVRQEALGAHACQDLPFEQLVDLLQPERDRSRTPFFQVVFNYEPDRGEPLSLGDLDVSLVDVAQTTVLCDLRLVLVEDGDVLAGTVEYSTDLFDRSTVERMAGHLVSVLTAVAADPQQRISELPLLTDDEHRQVVETWNDTARPVPAVGGVHELVENHAARDPEATAVVYGDETLTYGQLDQRANRLAHHMRSLGVGPDVVVGLCLERGVELVVGMLAVLKAAGAYLALDPDYPAPRLSFMLGDSRVSVLVGREVALDVLPGSRARTVVLDDPATIAAIERCPAAPPDVAVRGDHLAYVMYTSGSTGEPKGIGVCHRGVVSLVTVGDYVDFRADDVVAQVSTPSFDAATFEIWGALANGGALVGIDREALLSPQLLVGELERYGATVLLMTPALFNRVAAEAPAGLRGLRYLLTGGDAADPSSLRRVLGEGRPGHLLNAYGPAENTVIVACHQVEDDVGDVVPIGRPIGNVQAYVLDASMAPAPVGVPGELFVGGEGVARGYQGRGALTAERFVAHPFDCAGARLYRTGDRVRWAADGRLEFLGRVDNQVKVRGFRIEPGEIETALLAHPGVSAAAVVARDDDDARRLVAYAVPSDVHVGIPAPADLRAFLAASLPGHMVPALFVELDALPLSPNGKVDRGALPAPDASRISHAAGFVAPSTRTEEVLAAAWAEVLGLGQVGVHDNFFELGGDSIMSIQAVARARRAGVHVTPAQLFEQQTVAGLANVADREPLVDAEQGPVAGEVPLVPIQRWFFERDLPDAHHYNQSFLVEVSSQRPVEPLLLDAALAAVVEHHDALRSRFAGRGDAVVQTCSATVPGGLLSMVDVAGLDEVEVAARMQAVGAECQASLSPETGDLLRAVLFERGEWSERGAPQALLVVIHHLVVDAVSWRILLEDLASAYEQLERGEPVQLPLKTTSFKRWAERLVELAATAELVAEADHWRDVGGTSARVELPRDHDVAEEANTTASARTVQVSLDPDQTSRLLQELPAAFRTQINDALLGALAVVLTELSGAPTGSPVIVDLEGHGREDVGGDVDVSRTVGWFTTIFPVALATEQDPVDLPATLVATKERLREVPRRGLGYGVLRYLSTGEAHDALAAATPAELSFNYLGQLDQALAPGRAGTNRFSAAAEGLGPEQAATGQRTHLLDIDAVVSDGRLRLDWTYSENVHDLATIEALARRYVAVLEELVERCCDAGAGSATPSDFPLVDLDQRTLDLVHDQLAESFGRTP